MNPLMMFAAGAWGMLSVIAFKDGEYLGSTLKSVAAIALIFLAAL